MDYTDHHLQKIQEYRALVERPKQPKSEPIGDAEMLSLPNDSLSLLIDQLSDERPNPLPDVDIERLIDECANIALTTTDIPTPYPVTNAVIESAANSHTSSIGPAVKASDNRFLRMAEELLPLYEAEIELDGCAIESVFLALYKRAALDREQERIMAERLNRIHRADEPQPYTEVTATELARTLSHRSLTDASLVTRGGVGVMYSALIEMLEEQGMNPDDILPHGYLGQIADESVMGMMGGGDESEPTDLDSLDTVGDLVDENKGLTSPLKENVKHLRDCYFLRELYDPILEKIDIENPNCPRMVWKAASLDVQNGDDPFSAEDADEKIPTGKLMKVQPGSEPDSPAADSGQEKAESSTQAGIGDF